MTPPAKAPPLPPRGRPASITLDQISLPPARPAGAVSLPAPTRAARLPSNRAPNVADIYTDALAGADELTIDPSAPPNETRFSKAPPRRRGDSLDLDLSDLELQPRSLTPSRASLAPEPSAGALAKLPLFPLFAEVGREALATLVRDSDLVELEDGALLMRKGDQANALYGILEGSVRLMVPGQHIQLTLAEGDVFGEACLLQDEPRNADAVVVGHVVALRIPREVLYDLIRQYPAIAEVLLGLLTRRLLGNLLQTSALFTEFSSAERMQVARMFEIRRAAAGTALAQCGKRMDGLYISLTGRLLVTGDDGTAQTVGPGTMFGQGALLSHAPSEVDIVATVNMIVLRLPTEGFTQVAMQHPSMLMRLSELATEAIVKVTT